MVEGELVLLDASALLALAREETGADRVRRSLPSASINAVNVAECLAVLSRYAPTHAAAQAVARLGLNVISCDWQTSTLAADFHASMRDRGLTLSECIGLATARRLGATLLTANRALAGLDVGVAIEVLG